MYVRITSMHVVPFDIGTHIDDKKKRKIEQALQEYEPKEISELMENITMGACLAKRLSDNVSLYIYNYGVGVFVIWDAQPFKSNDKDFGIRFSRSRSNTHHAIYNNNHAASSLMRKVMDTIWKSLKKRRLRKTIDAEWGLKNVRGLLYAMTVDYLESPKEIANYTVLDKKNLCIILNPSIAGVEDRYSEVAKIESSQFVNIGLGTIDPYQHINIDMLSDGNTTNDDVSVYSSWATTLVCTKENNEKIKILFECFQVELQAFWFYTYIMTKMQYTRAKYSEITAIRKLLFDYSELARTFEESYIMKIPFYLQKIWGNMIDTSFINSHILSAKNNLQHQIDSIESKIHGNQYHYMKITNILVLIIAYIQIAPFVYGFFSGDYPDIELIPLILTVFILIILIFFEWKKE